jgi:hypothetical protein
MAAELQAPRQPRCERMVANMMVNDERVAAFRQREAAPRGEEGRRKDGAMLGKQMAQVACKARP